MPLLNSIGAVNSNKKLEVINASYWKSITNLVHNQFCFNSTRHFIEAKYLPDINNGVHDMFIFCDKLEGVPVGNTISELLCTVQMGKGETLSYTPPSAEREFKKGFIESLHFKITDSTGKHILFNFGNVFIQCLVHQ